MTMNLGRLVKVDLRSVWSSESSDFTPWLARAENLAVLGETVGIDLELEAQEKDVGPFRADILCKDLGTESWVLIENQLERTDHTHLGQLLVYASGLKAVTIVWVAQRFTEEHRATLDWLNAITDDQFRFFGLEVELWRIGQSEPAPKFNVVSKPNDWSRQVSQAAHRIETGELSDVKRTQLEFWTGFMKHLAARGSRIRPVAPRPQHWAPFSIGRTGFRLDAMALVRDRGMAVNLVLTDEKAKPHFHLLAQDRALVETEIGMPLQWRELPSNKESHVYTGAHPADYAARDRWPEYYDWLADKAEAYVRVLGPRIRELRAETWTGPSHAGEEA